MDEIAKIVADIIAGQVKPIYFLMGEEAYYIDKLSEYIEKNVLQEHERDFNQTVLYGRDVTIDDIVSAAKRYPMMADRQVIIVKEAQDLVKTINQIEKYAENPMSSTVLVFCYKYKSLAKNTKAYKQIAKNGLVFESKKLYDNQIGQWISRVLQPKDYKIDAKANAMLVEFLGTDLSKINNELEKLQLILPKGSTITATHIEENIGFSKDFNVFELRKMLAVKNQLSCYKIVKYFADNPKDNNIVMVVGLVFAFFIQVQKYHGTKDKNPAKVAGLLGVSPYFLKDYDIAIKNYNMKKVSSIINTLRDIDVKSKGVGANGLPLIDLYNEMLAKVFA
ncbi:MAG: polymerase subunit delta [Bacteroidota bacterium]|jgi:DNA polymerase-3 subunit delta